jgi:hypothetical protein
VNIVQTIHGSPSLGKQWNFGCFFLFFSFSPNYFPTAPYSLSVIHTYIHTVVCINTFIFCHYIHIIYEHAARSDSYNRHLLLLSLSCPLSYCHLHSSWVCAVHGGCWTGWIGIIMFREDKGGELATVRYILS